MGLAAPRFIAALTGITVDPIVTEDTLKKGKNYDRSHRPLPLGHGTFEYVTLGRRALNEGALVWVSPQQGRRPRLELSDKEPMRFLLGREHDAQRVAILFLGLSLHQERITPSRVFSTWVGLSTFGSDRPSQKRTSSN